MRSRMPLCCAAGSQTRNCSEYSWYVHVGPMLMQIRSDALPILEDCTRIGGLSTSACLLMYSLLYFPFSLSPHSLTHSPEPYSILSFPRSEQFEVRECLPGSVRLPVPSRDASRAEQQGGLPRCHRKGCQDNGCECTILWPCMFDSIRVFFDVAFV